MQSPRYDIVIVQTMSKLERTTKRFKFLIEIIYIKLIHNFENEGEEQQQERKEKNEDQ